MDPIANMLTIIRNAQAVNKPTVFVPFSKIKFEIVRVLKENGFIRGCEKKGKKPNKIIEITLNNETQMNIKRISKSGQRVYVKKEEIRPVRQGFGIAILSTSQGIMTNKEARKKGLGGEIICEVY